MPNENREKLLSERFIESYDGIELFPPVYNVSALMAANNRLTSVYYKKYYQNTTPSPAMSIIKRSESIFFEVLDKFRSISEETFEDYWKNIKKLEEIQEEYKKFEKALDDIYEKLSYSFVEKTDIKELIEESRKADIAAWTADSRGLCSIYLDMDFCLKFIKKLKMNITEERLNEIWDPATTPVSDSFEKRRLIAYLKLLEQKTPEDEIAEKCDYFYSGFYDVPNLQETKKKLREKYKEYQNDEELIKKTIEEDKREKEKKENQFNEWLSTLNKEEKKLVCYLQFMIELRDMRKDVYGKVLAIRYRVARKMFKEAEIPEEFIPYYRCDEMEKGLGYLEENKEKIKSRENGFCTLMHYDGKIEFQYGHFDENKKVMDDFYLEKNKAHINQEEIKGQPACSGKVTGNVKIIKNVTKDSEKFNAGDVLVAGMTRVEFVPLMKKASAIITDEGGITCHAAIISRELKIPCIIGTRIATKVLKDNDLVEIDANKGIIKILKKAESKA